MTEKPTRRLEVCKADRDERYSRLYGEPGQSQLFSVSPGSLEAILDTLRAWGRLVEPSESEE